MEEIKNQEQQDAGKVLNAYNATMKKLVAVVGGEKNLLPTKRIGKDMVAQVVEGLLKDKKETIEKEVKDDLVKLLDKHVEFKKAIALKEQEMKQLKESKMKEFTEAAKKVFGKIDSIGDLEKDYYDSLNTAGNAGEVSSK